AEDGIRGPLVTGVQTCALPIWDRERRPRRADDGLLAASTARGAGAVSARLEELQPWLYPWASYLVRFASAYGAHVTSVRRSWREQAALYADYLAGYSPYPAAPPGQSMHQLGRAFDLAASAKLLAYLGAT